MDHLLILYLAKHFHIQNLCEFKFLKIKFNKPLLLFSGLFFKLRPFLLLPLLSLLFAEILLLYRLNYYSFNLNTVD